MDSRDWRASLPIHLLGGTIVVLAIGHLLLDTERALYEGAEAAILLVFAGIVFIFAVRIGREALDSAQSTRISGIALATGLGVFVLAAVFVALRYLTREPFSEGEYILSIGWSLGIAAGVPIGYYVVRTRQSLADHRNTNKRLTILQRVLRHNLRNEINILLGLTWSAQGTAQDEQTAAHLNDIESHIARIQQLAEETQALSTVWNVDECETINLTELIEDQVAALRETYPDLAISSDIPDGVVVCAHPNLDDAIEEVFANAAEHNDPDSLELMVRLSPSDGSTDFVTLTIADTGRGIPASEIEALQQPEERPLVHTTGLGLWLVYWVVEKSDGILRFRDNDPTGTVVTIRLPVADG